MPASIVVSNDMWNEKSHATQVSSFDSVDVYVHFDQPISHDLEYIENDVTRFWVEITHNGELVSRLAANKVLNELMDEARMFKNGKFKFSLCKLPDALTQHFHAAFATYMAGQPAGSYTLVATLYTDNPLQVGKPLAERQFTFVVEPNSAEHLQKVAQVNTENGADREEDPEAKAAFYARMNQSKLATATSTGTQLVKIQLKGSSGDVRVRLHTGPGTTLPTTIQQNIISTYSVVVGSPIELLGPGDSKIRDLVTVRADMEGMLMNV
jgi:hypothetical protein